MSEYITHIAVLEDTARLALHSNEICEAFKTCFSPKYLINARMGSSARGNTDFIVPLLTRYRDIWDSRKSSDRLEEKLAFALGWIAHRNADRFFKPLYPVYDDNPENLHPVDIRVLHDVVVYQKVYNSGVEEPFSPGFLQENMKSHPAAGSVELAAAASLFGSLYQAELMSLQSFSPSLDEEAWMTRFLEQHQERYVDVDRYIKGVNDPDPGKMQKLIITPNFYKESDPVILLARAIQHDKMPLKVKLDEAINADNQSQYGQVLSRGYVWLREASRYFTGEISDKDYMNDYYEIGKPPVPE